jgi:molecular chaperone GrpE (heat shock protein)
LAAEQAENRNALEKAQSKMALLENQLMEKTRILLNVSEAFIELRKELLSAKSNGQPIDPNQNKNMDKVARLLGHY